MNKRCTFFAVVMAGGLVGCGGDEDDASDLRFGVLAAQSGPLDFTFAPITGALDVARFEINAGGGVLGQEMEFVLRDTQFGLPESDPAARVAELSAEGVEVSFGAISSSSTAAAIPAAVEEQMVLLNSASGNPTLTDIPDDGLFFRSLPPQGNQGVATAAYLVDQELTSVTILQRSPDGQLAQQGANYIAAMDAAGLTIYSDSMLDENNETVLVPYTYTYTDEEGLGTDATDRLDQLYVELPDALVILDFQPGGAALLEALDRARYPGRVLVFSAMATPQMVTLVGAAKVEGVEAVSIRVAAGDALEGFRSAYMTINGTELDFFPLLQTSAYDAVALAALATEAAGTYDARAIADELRNVGNPPGVVVQSGDLARGLELVRQGMDIDYQGVASNGDVDAQGVLSDDLALYRFADGELDEIRTFEEGTDY